MLHPSIITLLGEQYKSWISSLRNFLRLQITDVHTGRAGCVQAHTDVQGGKKVASRFNSIARYALFKVWIAMLRNKRGKLGFSSFSQFGEEKEVV